jgi:NNP family nitrate/nitrite transporter-like MFS transporter
MIAGLMLLSFATDFTGLLSGRGIWQIGIRFLLPALTAALVVSVPDKHRSTALGINISVSMAGTWAAQIIGAKMSLSYGWQTSIQFFAAIVALAAVISFIFYRGKAAAQGEALKADKTAVNPNEKSVYAMPSVWLLCLLVIFACEEGLVDGIASLQMAEKCNTDALQFAKITGWGIGLAIIINLVAGWCGDKYGRWNMLIASGVLNTMVGVCLWLGEINHKGIYITGILIAKGLQMTTTLFVNSMAPTFLKGRDVGPIIAIIMLGGGLGQYLGPQVLGIFRDVTGSYTAGWIYIAACGVMATMFAIGFKLYFDRKQKAEAAGGKV